jgi:hypothetical protein
MLGLYQAGQLTTARLRSLWDGNGDLRPLHLCITQSKRCRAFAAANDNPNVHGCPNAFVQHDMAKLSPKMGGFQTNLKTEEEIDENLVA